MASKNRFTRDFRLPGEPKQSMPLRGVSALTFDRALNGVTPDPSVLEAMQTQPEFETPVWEYLARLVDDKRIAEGQARLAAWAPMLARAEDAFGVDRYTLVAVWGVE